MPIDSPAGRERAKRSVHWHIIFTHFPISLYGTAFRLQVLHLFAHAV